MTYDNSKQHDSKQHGALHLGLVALLTLAAACGGSDAETSSSTGTGGSDGTGGMGAAGGSGGMGGDGTELVCEPGETRACYEGDEATEGVGLCIGGTETCLPDGSGWGACEDQVLPAESDDCSAIGDEDCDGIACSETVWATAIASDNSFLPFDIAVGPTGKTVVVGYATGTVTVGNQTYEATTRDVLVLAFDPSGALLWMTAGVSSSSLTEPGGVAIDETGAVYVAGKFRQSLNFGPNASTELVGFQLKDDIFVAKLDANGQHIWSRYLSGRAGLGTFDPTGAKWVGDIVVDASGVYVAGYYDGHFGGVCLNGCNTSTYEDVWIRKLTRDDGANVWNKLGTSSGQDKLFDVELHPSGSGIVVSGNTTGDLTLGGETLPLVGNKDAWLASLDADGNLSWSQSLGAPNGMGYPWSLSSSAAGVLVAGDFEFAISLGTDLYGGIEPHAFVGLIDGMGTPQWGRAFGSSTGMLLGAMASWDDEGDILLGGTFTGSVSIGNSALQAPANVHGGFLSKLDPVGEPIWTQAYTPLSDIVRLEGMAIGPDNHPHFVALATGPVDVGGFLIPGTTGGSGIVARVQP